MPPRCEMAANCAKKNINKTRDTFSPDLDFLIRFDEYIFKSLINELVYLKKITNIIFQEIA